MMCAMGPGVHALITDAAAVVLPRPLLSLAGQVGRGPQQLELESGWPIDSASSPMGSGGIAIGGHSDFAPEAAA
jgi:hypothetical protein